MSKVVKKLKKGVKKATKGIKKGVNKLGKNLKKYGPAIAGAAAIAFGGAGLMGMGPLGGMLGGVGSSMSSGIGSMFGGAKSALGFGEDPLSAFGGAGASVGGSGGGSGFNWGNMAMAGLDAYGSYQTGRAQQEGNERALSMMNPFAGQRGQYATQLSNLYSDPNAVTKLPGYQFQLEQGTKAMNAANAQSGNRFSGKALIEAQQFGQGLASQMRQQEIQNLSMLSGASFGPSGGNYAVGAATAMPNAYQEGFGTVGHALGYGGNR